MSDISIIGFGRFGKTLYRLLKDDFSITIYFRHGIDSAGMEFTGQTNVTSNLTKIYKNKTIFFAVPISAFGNVIKTHKKYFNENHLLIDVLSVKVYPKKIFSKYVKDKKIQILLSHPMFGPDSSKNGFNGLPIILDQFRTDRTNYNYWKQYFSAKGLRIVEMPAEQHDKVAAKSQGLTHFIGRLLEKINFEPTAIDSLGSKKLLEIKEQTCNDTWQLFKDLQTYNPYTKQMRTMLGNAYTELYDQLLPKRVNPKYYLYGIQGGIASFNEQALLYYLDNIAAQKNINYRIKYLYTTEKVLRNLIQGNMDYGLFAITNSNGGLVDESILAITRYPCHIVDDFEILVRHFLMKRKDTDFKDIKTIMAHPQVLKQCERTLKKRYHKYSFISGTGDAIDTAKAAEYLSLGKLPKTTAILGPQGIQQRFNFDIIAGDLQDKKDNYTRFLLVRR